MLLENIEQQLAGDEDLLKIAQELPSYIGKLKREKRDFDLCVLYSRDMHQDKQWEAIVNGRIIEPRRDAGEVRITANFIRRVVQIFVAEAMAQNYRWHVHAYEGDDRRIGAADVAEQLMKDHYIELMRDGIALRNYINTNVDGECFLVPEFYPNAGEQIGADPTTGTPIYKGDIVPHLYSTMDAYFYDNYPSLNEGPMFGTGARMNPKDVKARWNLPDEPPPSSKDDTSNKRWKSNFGSDASGREPEVEVIRIWLKRGNGILPDNPKYGNGVGFTYIASTDTIVEFHPAFPYPFDDPKINKYPIVMFRCEPRADKTHCTSLVEPLVGLQMEYNRTLSQIAQAKNYIGTPGWRAARGSISNKDDINTRPGGVTLYNPLQGIAAPEPIQMPGLAQFVTDMPKNLEDIAFKIHGASEIAQAGQPGSVNSYSGIQKLSEIQNKLFRPRGTEWREAWAFYGKIWLMMKRKYTDVADIVRIVDDAGDIEVKDFMGADLPSNFDVVVSTDIGAETEQEKKQRLLQEAQLKLLTPDDYKKEVYGIEHEDKQREARQLALRENDAMLAGQIIDNTQLASLLEDDHAQHFEVNGLAKRDPRYGSLPPEAQAAIIKHQAIHWLGFNDQQAIMETYVKPQLIQMGAIPAPPPVQPMGGPVPPATPQGNPPRPEMPAQKPPAGV